MKTEREWRTRPLGATEIMPTTGFWGQSSQNGMVETMPMVKDTRGWLNNYR